MNYLPIEVVIVEDELSSQKNLLHNLDKNYPEIVVLGLARTVEEACKLIIEKKPNLVFLDVALPDGSGFDILQQLPSTDFEVVFVTAFGEYAIQAIKFHALDFLLKPYKEEEFNTAMSKVKNAISNKVDNKRINQLLQNLQTVDRGNHKIVIPTNSGREYIPISEISYCTSDKKYTTFFLKDERKLVSSTNIGHYEKLFPGQDEIGQTHHIFCRSHHRYLVNLHYVKSYNRKEEFLLLSNGEAIPIAYRRKSKVLDWLSKLGA